MTEALTSAAREEEQIARIDRVIAFVMPTRADLPKDLDEPAMRRLAVQCDEAYALATRGPRDYGPQQGHRPDWIAPWPLLERDRAERNRLAATIDRLQRAAIFLGYARRWHAIADLSELDRRLLQNRANVVAWNEQQKQIAAQSAASVAALGGAGFSATKFLAGLAGRGAHAAVVNGELRLGPKRVISDRDLSIIRDHRAEIVAALTEDIRA